MSLPIVGPANHEIALSREDSVVDGVPLFSLVVLVSQDCLHASHSQVVLGGDEGVLIKMIFLSFLDVEKKRLVAGSSPKRTTGESVVCKTIGTTYLSKLDSFPA